MIDVATTWQQACTALAAGDYDTAFDVLEAALREAQPAQRGPLHLYLASVHSLYGDPALPDVQRELQRATRTDPALASTPLYAALDAERHARAHPEEPTPPAVPPAVHAAADPLARYHAVCALALGGDPQAALDVHLPITELPVHLRWRLRSWQADAQESLGHTQDAAHLYAEAAHLSAGLNRATMLQEQAALELQLGNAEGAKRALDQARPLYPTAVTQDDDALNLATWHYLRAQAMLNLGRPEAAQDAIREADRLEREHGDPSYGVALVRGQVLTHLGQTEAALTAFQDALTLAAPQDRPYANHELGVALLDLDRPVDAREKLEAALHERDYPFQPEVLADLAECDYRLGRLAEAQAGAEAAMAQGAVVPASLVLGSVALDYFQLDEALEHYERVIREAAPETRDWILAHQMAADIMAQQGFPNPSAAYAHAQQALALTPESDDWHATLQDYVTRTQALIGTQGGGRTLN